MIKFLKYQADGNDFILIPEGNFNDNQLSELAKLLCMRYFSVGADGLLYVSKKDNYYFMKIFNSDGSQAQMCGNGIRIFFHYLYSTNKVRKSAQIYTLAGLKEVSIDDKENIKVNMGKVEQKYYNIKKDFILIDNYKIYLVWPGNPHGVIFFDEDIDYSLFINLANKFKENSFFKHGINLDFVYIKDKHNIKTLIYERGVGPTLSCGTGAVASGYASIIYKGLESPVKVQMPGGTLTVSKESGEVYLEGKVKKVFEGRLDINDSIIQ